MAPADMTRPLQVITAIEQSNHLLSSGKPVRDDVDHDDSDA